MNDGQPSPSVQPPAETQDARICVIIPVYQVEPYIAECLESVIQQSFPHIEIICVDDRGTDRSWAIVEEFAQRDKRIRLVRNSENRGQGYCRNVGIELSHTPYIMFLDSDDTYEPTMCEKMYDAIVSAQADIGMCGTRVSYEADESMLEADNLFFAMPYEGVHTVDDELIATCDNSVWDKIFRRELMDRFDIRFPDGLKYEDAYFYNACMAHAKTIVFVNEKLYHYRRRQGSTMNQTFTKATTMGRDHLSIAFLLHEHYVTWNLFEGKYAYFCRFFLICTDFALMNCPATEEDNILCLAGDFVRKHLHRTEGLPADAAKRIELLRCAFRVQSWGHLLRIRTRPFAKYYSFLGIPLYRILYTPFSTKHYLFGIKILKKKYDLS